ncbi:DUF5710 domain-containing protein [Pseudomonas sp. AA4]|uniref:LPD7 domain-containing protein n=2 Tax=unclassified Pseudomonas TaxID=196821 RepID=UPI002B225735|nr:LPD7 domain-containing protein [Pseudomonas sp. AA4]MEA9996487.1 DUF5710 domain-containing protein [Pseudomonas sp. AA4]
MKTSEHPFWLAVPYEEREVARERAGDLANGQSALKWDEEAKLFFARPGSDLERLRDWWPDSSRRAGGGDAEAEFLDALTQEGLVIKGMPVMDGQRQRVATVEDKNGKKSGVYRGYLDRRPGGWFINYHRAETEKSVTNWKATGGEADPITQLHIRAGARQAQEEAGRLREETYVKQTLAAKNLYDRLPAADPAHPYMVRKEIPPTPDLRQTKNGALVVPFFNASGEFRTLQYISPDGEKFLFKDAPKQGHFLVVGGALTADQPLLYAEGYATARSLNLAIGHPVVMTIDAGNMVAVAKVLHEQFPDSTHLFLADFDHAKAENKGLMMATLAAEQVGGQVLYPDFTDEEKARGLTDYNDLHQSRGLDAVRSHVVPVLNQINEGYTMQDDRTPEDSGMSPYLPSETPTIPGEVTAPAPAAKKPRSPRTPKTPMQPQLDEASTATAAVDSQAPLMGLAAGLVEAAEPQSSETLTSEPSPKSEPELLKEASDVAVKAPLATQLTVELGTELTPDERNMLQSQGWTDEQLSDIPADQARSALAGELIDLDNIPLPVAQPEMQVETIDLGATPLPDVKPVLATDVAGTMPAEVPVITPRLVQAGSDEAQPVAQTGGDSIWVGPPRPRNEEAQPKVSQIDKDALLSRLTSELQSDKTVLYKLDGEPAFIDRGMRLEMVDGASQNDEKVLAALLTAAEYYRGRIELTGSDAFQRKAIGLIAQHQLNVTMKNPAQQMQLVEARKALQDTTVERDSINGEPPPAYGASHQPSAEPADSPADAATTVSKPAAAPAPVANPVMDIGEIPQSDARQSAEKKVTQASSNEQPASSDEQPSPGNGFTKTISPEVHQNHQAAQQGVTGKVIAFGSAPFRFEDGNTDSTYIKLRTKTGQQTYWGKELAGLLRETRVQPGKVVTLQWLGKEPVVVRVPIKDDQGVTMRFDEKNAHRNQWSLTVMGGTSVRTGQDDGVKLAAYDVQRFGQVQQALMARTRLDIPLPSTPKDGLFWLTPDGQGSSKTGDALSAPRPGVDNKAAGQPVMSSWSEDGHLDMLLVRGDGPYLQGVVRQDGQFQHVLVSLPGSQDAPAMVFNVLTAAGLVPIGSGNAINRSGGVAVSRENIAFKLDGDTAVRIGKLDKPAEVPPALHARLGFDERWSDDNTLPKSAPAAAPSALPSDPRPA